MASTLIAFMRALLLLLIVSSASADFEFYDKLDYALMRTKLSKLNSIFPDVVRVDTAENLFGIEYLVECEDDEDCVLDIVSVTDHLTGPEDKVQVYVSGCFNGAAQVGPHVAYYLIEYLASNFNKDPYITYLLQHREIIVTPMTNAVGFYQGRESEKTR